MTYREMCEALVLEFKKVGITTTAKEIFELSPTGELYHIPLFYEYFILNEGKDILDDQKTDGGNPSRKAPQG